MFVRCCVAHVIVSSCCCVAYVAVRCVVLVSCLCFHCAGPCRPWPSCKPTWTRSFIPRRPICHCVFVCVDLVFKVLRVRPLVRVSVIYNVTVTQIHTDAQRDSQSAAHTRCTYAHTPTLPYTHARMHTHTHTLAYTHTHTCNRHSHTFTAAHVHTCTHTRIHDALTSSISEYQ